MGRASSSKKVARAAAAGRRARVRRDRSLTFPAAIAVVVILGVALIVVANQEQANADNTPPRAGLDHWHAAFGIYDCDAYLPDLTNQNDPTGIHTHADGIIHIHPFLTKAAGKNARLDDFFDAVDLDVSDTEVKDTGFGEDLESGADCNGLPTTLRLLRWDSPIDTEPDVITNDFGSTRLEADAQVFALVFAPEGATIPQPPSTAKLQDLSLLDDVFPTEPNAGVDETVPDETTDTTVAGDPTDTTVAGDPTATTVAGDPTATTVAAASTTSAP